MSKWQFRKLVSKYVTELNRAELLEDPKKYKKVSFEAFSSEEFKRKDYFNELKLDQIRDRFRLKSQMFGDLKGSFPSKFRKQGKSLKCEMCKNILQSNTSLNVTCSQNMESQNHFLEICPSVSDIKTQFDTNTDLGIIQFFRAVLERRADMIDS